mmetsp:Transcript_33960/g.86830  ORF Transcript_33960/g.86830 Transcript_33960/m.86830 type:complete len:244 (-) Transcript_33960:181-912(-)|eukprot:jgi/Tetstr1/432060/TSEL_021531.t1
MSSMAWQLAQAAALTGGVALAWKLACTSLLPSRLGLSVADSRKLMHIGTGMLYMMAWPVFPEHPLSPYVAAIVPAGMTLQFAAVGLGLMRDRSLVASVSREGRPAELLLGPLQYGMVHSAVALACWRTSLPGVMALACLCAGDGLAEMVGRRLGRRSGALPHNPSKSWAGTAAFVLGSAVGAAAIVAHFSMCGVMPPRPLSSFVPRLLLTSVAAAAVETLPLKDWDNVTVPVTALLVSSCLCP